jgi:TPR repeat protein
MFLHRRESKRLIVVASLCIITTFFYLPSWATNGIDYKKLPFIELQRIAENGDPEAQFIVSAVLSSTTKDIPGIQKSNEQSLAWLLKAAEQGHANAQWVLGTHYYYGTAGLKQDYQEAARWLRKAAEQGIDDAQYHLAVMHNEGQGVPQDYKESVYWLRKAAAQGNASAQHGLGLMYVDGGKGVPQDYQEAAAWFRKAAQQGDADAQYSLGFVYYKGQGVPQDYKEAIVWLRKAAEQGHADAQNNLGVAYRNGQGIQRDLVLAYMLCNLAAAGGNGLGAKNRSDLLEIMSQKQIEEGQALTSKWKIGMPLPATSKTGKEAEKKPLAANSPSTAAPPKKTGNCRPTGPSIRCQSRCTNSDCIVTYENGCEVRVQVQPKFNPFNSQWEYPAPGC